jgi:CBS domain-containing protein
MTPVTVTLSASATAADAARVMRDRGSVEAVVVDEGALVGLLTERDVADVAGDRADTITLGGLCHHEPTVVSPVDTAMRGLALMRESAVAGLPVVQGGRVVGIVLLGVLSLEAGS